MSEETGFLETSKAIRSLYFNGVISSQEADQMLLDAINEVRKRHDIEPLKELGFNSFSNLR